MSTTFLAEIPIDQFQKNSAFIFFFLYEFWWHLVWCQISTLSTKAKDHGIHDFQSEFQLEKWPLPFISRRKFYFLLRATCQIIWNDELLKKEKENLESASILVRWCAKHKIKVKSNLHLILTVYPFLFYI